jgi:DNA-binding NtrC family response regulator
LDEKGVVEFLSDRVGRIDGVAPQSVGKLWKEVFPFAREIKQQIEIMSRNPANKRCRVPVSWKSASGKQYWLELEIQNDPRDDRKRIFYLYDVSQVHDLQLELDRQRVGKMVGNSAAMRKVYEMFQEVARGDWNVLVEGETGTGKELVARGIHAASARRDAPFIAVNCAGLSESLVASQLFGHKRGAFTGAVSDQLGVFEAAAGGTVFLDEIGDVPPSVQTSLLRVLEQREIMRVGESKPRPVNVRIIAATHQDLEAEIEHGRFRRDLLYRLRVGRVEIPPLRKRTEDIPLLVAAFLAESRVSTGKALTRVSSEAMSHLIGYAWPGNVRELKNAVDYAAIHCKTSLLQTEDFPEEIRLSPGPTPRAEEPVQGERERILDALKRAGGNRSRAAKILGVSRATLYRRLSEFGIGDPN